MKSHHSILQSRGNNGKTIFNNHISIYLVVGLLLAACAGTVVKSPPPSQSTDKHLVVSGTVETADSYCGGAPPPEEMLREIEKKKPLVGYKLYIKEGEMNTMEAPIIDSALTNEAGKFEFNLLPGKYLLLSSNHISRDVLTRFQNEKYIKIYDEECLDNWWHNGMAKLILDTQAIDTIYFHLKKECFLPLGIPCLVYNGPVPP